MKRTAAAAVAMALALSACGREEEQPAQQQAAPQQTQPTTSAATAEGVTPMNERVAVIGLLNKRNGIVRNLRMTPGQSVRVKDAIVRLRACETTAPWESEKLTGAFLQLDVQGTDDQWRRAFSGWVYKESPSLNVVEHPVYDVWPRSCAMTFPAGDAAPSAPSASSSRSSSQNSPGPSRRGAEPPSPSPSADASNST